MVVVDSVLKFPHQIVSSAPLRPLREHNALLYLPLLLVGHKVESKRLLQACSLSVLTLRLARRESIVAVEAGIIVFSDKAGILLQNRLDLAVIAKWRLR